MPKTADIGMNHFTLDGEEIGKSVISWTYGVAQGGQQPGSRMALKIDRIILVDGIPKQDDSGLCVCSEVYFNPIIKIDMNGGKPQIIVPRGGKQN